MGSPEVGGAPSEAENVIASGGCCPEGPSRGAAPSRVGGRGGGEGGEQGGAWPRRGRSGDRAPCGRRATACRGRWRGSRRRTSAPLFGGSRWRRRASLLPARSR